MASLALMLMMRSITFHNADDEHPPIMDSHGPIRL